MATGCWPHIPRTGYVCRIAILQRNQCLGTRSRYHGGRIFVKNGSAADVAFYSNDMNMWASPLLFLIKRITLKTSYYKYGYVKYICYVPSYWIQQAFSSLNIGGVAELSWWCSKSWRRWKQLLVYTAQFRHGWLNWFRLKSVVVITKGPILVNDLVYVY